MAITRVTTVTVTCDMCNQQVTDPSYVSAMVYGVTAHLSCWAEGNGPNVARLLGLDEIVIRRTEDERTVDDTRYGATRAWFRENGPC